LPYFPLQQLLSVNVTQESLEYTLKQNGLLPGPARVSAAGAEPFYGASHIIYGKTAVSDPFSVKTEGQPPWHLPIRG